MEYQRKRRACYSGNVRLAGVSSRGWKVHSRQIEGPEVERLHAAFSEVFGPRMVPFGAPAWQNTPPGFWVGFYDGNEGVQWNAGIRPETGRANLGVNLTGKKYSGWPIARLIERELASSEVFSVISQLSAPNLIQTCWWRNYWQAGVQIPIREHRIGCVLLSDLRPDKWKQMLIEALECLYKEKGHRGRGTQTVTFVSGQKKKGPVSPSLTFARELWTRFPNELSTCIAAIWQARTELQPVYDFVARRSS